MKLNPFGGKKQRRHNRRPQAAPSPVSWLKPETKRAVTGVLLITLAIITVFSFFGQSGKLGDGLLLVWQKIFGWLAYVMPVVVMWIGYRLVRPAQEALTRTRLAGFILVFVGLLGGLHLIGGPVDESLQVAYEGGGGGFLGFLLSYPLSLALSPLMSGLIFIAASLIGVCIGFDVSPSDVGRWIKGLVPGSASADSEDESEEDGDREETESRPAGGVLPRFHLTPIAKPVTPDPDQAKLEQQAQQEKQQEEMRRKQLKQANREYHPPSLDLLLSTSRQPEGGDVEGNKEIIAKTLENFGITVTMGKAKVGPTVTQYTLRPDEGVRLSQITALQNDLARALRAHPVRIEAPIPNTDLVGIEIPNKEVALVRLHSLLSSKEVKRSESPLMLALGKDVTGSAVTAELDRMPHLLIAGATNSGKSVCIHTILMSLIFRNSPSLLRLVLVDPKRVELTAYNGIPHLWGQNVITDPGKTLNALKWAISEMDKRYRMLEETGSRNLVSYNFNHPDNAQPFIVIVIDELADLMAKHGREVEGPIVRLAQLARAVGIHLILATQRPSVNVITGLIKANVPARIAFKVASQVDSRTILDMGGAEKLLGTGDMLFLATDNTKPRRLQGGYISEEEVRAVVQFVEENNEADQYVAAESITAVHEVGGESSGTGESADDPLFEEAKRVAYDAGKVSASLLQRRLRVGYARAARILDMLEEEGIIGPAKGNKPREVIGNLEAGFDRQEQLSPDETEPGKQETGQPW